MRPLRLELEGVTCFRDPQVVDLAPLRLFAIAGPTGAGKTSLLDAMVYALYGQIPRIGAQGIGEFVSLGRDRMAVTFTFEVGGTRYRVARVHRRERGTRVQLEREEGGAFQPVADAVGAVRDEIERILGLGADAFQQSVLLPQGQFSRFLKAPPGSQRLILRSLLRIGVYEQLRKTAADRAERARGEAEALERRLDEDFRGATVERLAALEAEIRALEEEVAGGRAALAARRAALAGREERLRAWEEVRGHAARLGALDRRQREMEGHERRLADARRAAPVLPWVLAADQAAGERSREEARAAAEVATHAEARARLAAATATLAEAEALAGALPELERRIGALDLAVALLSERAAARRRVAVEREAVVALEAQVARHRAAGEEADRRARALGERVAALDARLAALGYDPAEHERLRELQPLAVGIAAARAALTAAERERARDHEERIGAERALERAATRLREAADARAGADARHLAARRAREEAERRHQAHVLRERLAPGEPCPVCERPLDAVPARGEVPALDQLRAEEQAAVTAAAEAARRHEDALRAQASAEASLARASEAERRSVAVHEERAAALRDRERALAEAVAGGVPDGEAPLEARLEARLRVLAAAAREAQHLSAERVERAAERERAAAEAAHAAERQAAGEGELARARQREAEAGEALTALEVKLRAATDVDEPLAAQQALRAEVTRVRAALERARAEHARASTTHARAEADARAAARAVEEAARRAAEARARAEQAARDAGFTDAAEARALALAPEAERALADDVERWRAERERARTRLADARVRAGEEEVTAAEVEAERAALAEADRALAERARALGAREEELAAVRGRVETAARLEAEREQVRAEHALYDQLASDLRGDRFERWLLDGTFRALVEGASVRLLDVSGGRYALAWHEDEFHVIDHDNAGELRRADTLSGGETFLASLCLALQLSEQVQRASGAVRLDSLFIDEGFGTLDPETLDTVAGAIEALGAGDRTVGIITHVAELTERLPARVIVRRGASGSTLETIVG